jgi:hypothetical protein
MLANEPQTPPLAKAVARMWAITRSDNAHAARMAAQAARAPSAAAGYLNSQAATSRV